MKIAVVGAGLAGSECAWILAETYGAQVTLYEMKSKNPTPAQEAPHLFAELVCSNSLKSISHLNPAGLLKDELRLLKSLVLAAADAHRVPAGESLSVEREGFSGQITRSLRNHTNVKVIEEIVTSLLPLTETHDAVVVATGPLTHDTLAQDLMKLTGAEQLYFYDAIAPILDGDTVDLGIAFWANRETRTQRFEGISNEKADYLNLPLNKEQYLDFVRAVRAGAKVPHHNFEEPRYFNGCQPIEVLAESGDMTLAFGPMKGRGLTDPKSGRWPYAAVQLRKESNSTQALNMVGFQTRLTWTAQKEILRTLPGLSQAEFHRFGSMHRNTYLVSPKLLDSHFSFRNHPKIHLAGQVMGVEGYLESTAMGNLVAHAVAAKLIGKTWELPSPDTCLGSLAHYVAHSDPSHFTPMNIHWGLFSELDFQTLVAHWDPEKLGPCPNQLRKLDKSVKRHVLSRRSQALFAPWQRQLAKDLGTTT